MTAPTAPTTFEEALQVLLDHLRETLLRKQADYGPGNILAFGELGVLVRANDKVERLKNLLSGRLRVTHINFQPMGREPAAPRNESLDDTWLDLAGYSILALMLRQGTFELPRKASGGA